MEIKRIALFLSAMLLATACTKTENKTKEAETQTPVFDSIKAAQLGADEYGMRTYIMAFLKRGSNTSLNATQRADLQKAHLKNIQALSEAGKLILAGPFLDTGAVRGIYIFAVPTIEEARKLTETDPAIQAGTLKMELKPWYGSAALMEVNTLHKTLQKRSITDN